MLLKEKLAAYVDDHPLVELWLAGLAEGTRHNYTKAMILYSEHTGLTPQELLDLKENGGRKAERLLDTFVVKVEGVTDARKKICVTAIHSFYKNHYLDLAARSGYSKVKYVEANNQKCPTQDEVRELTRNAHIRNDAIVNVASSGGFRLGTLQKLTWGDFEELWTWDGKIPVYVSVDSARLKGKGYKGTVEQHTFMTRHASEVLLRYAEWVRQRGEITPESPLFISRGANQHAKSFTAMSDNSIWATVTSLGDYGPHDLRRFQQTQLEAARVNPNWIKKMQGKKLRGEDNPYSRPKIEQMRNVFKIAEPFLTLASPQNQFDPLEIRKLSLRDTAYQVFQGDESKMSELDALMETATTMEKVDEVLEFFWSPGARSRGMKYRRMMRESPSI